MSCRVCYVVKRLKGKKEYIVNLRQIPIKIDLAEIIGELETRLVSTLLKSRRQWEHHSLPPVCLGLNQSAFNLGSVLGFREKRDKERHARYLHEMVEQEREG